MASWFKILDDKPDHPMYDVAEARKLLASLPKEDPLKALDEITSWLTSVKDTPGFRPDWRTGVIMLLDETGQPLHAELLRQYLAAPHLQDFQGMRLWQGAHGFMSALAEAYAVCVHEYQQAEKKPLGLKEQMPVICVRLLRAVAEQMKLELMRYLEVEQTIWEQLYLHYNFAETSQFADVMVHAYPGHVIHTNPQRELLRAVILYVSSPATLAPDQIEVSYRISARLASLFDFKEAPDPDCPYFLDLSKPAAPDHVGDKLQATPAMRFFGAVRAVPKIEDITSQNERGVIEQERRFGSEFTPDGKLTVLKHLHAYWGREPPHRHHERRNIHTAIEVVHTFKIISDLVTRIELNQIANLSEEDSAMLKERSKIDILEEEVVYARETWDILDVSVGGVGGIVPKATGTWVKIGALCGLKAQNSDVWWVGMIRRLHTDHQNKVHVGIEILAKKPLSVWLRSLGKGTERVSNWETSSGSFAYDYQPVILLPDTHNSYVNATMLMESKGYVPGCIYEVMMGEKSRNIELTGLLAEGEDYEQVSFRWLAG
ncbi:MAG: hypothetical protein KGJ19_01195 [Betaproteobacteria bacterium]|nr:hypothetical protein [Betaproteobacteria bacterium]